MTSNEQTDGAAVTIILARVEVAYEPIGVARVDLGERPKLREVPVAKALCWANKGTAEDLAKATKWATAEGYSVHTFPTTERRPLELAKAAALAGGFEVVKLSAPGRATDGKFFIGRLFREVPAHGLTVYELLDGRILDTREIADGALRPYAPVPLYVGPAVAKAMLTRHRKTQAAAVAA